jgi:protein involved in polysaccharide export with SLBB domain
MNPFSRTVTAISAIFLLLILCGCSTTKIEIGEFQSDALPSESSTYPEVITTGDVLEVRFFLNAEIDPSPYTLGIGDTITIEVRDHPDLTSREVIVLSDGTMSILSIGNMQVAGSSIGELVVDVTAAYRGIGIRNPLVTITVSQDQQRLHTLLGSATDRENGNLVSMPIYAGVPFELPFITAVAPDRTIEEIRVEVREKYRQSFGKQLEVTVNVQQRDVPTITVMGEVRMPGRITSIRPLTPFSAVAAAGGFSDRADPEHVAVIRFRDDGNYSRWIFDLKNALGDPDSPQHNFRLSYEDVVVVVMSGVADVNVWVDQYIRRMIPVSIGIGIPVTR